MLQSFPAQREQAAAAAALTAKLGVNPDSVRGIFVPYRIVPLGAHVDHQGGQVLGRTIPAFTALVYAPLAVPEIHSPATTLMKPLSFLSARRCSPRCGGGMPKLRHWRWARTMS